MSLRQQAFGDRSREMNLSSVYWETADIETSETRWPSYGEGIIVTGFVEGLLLFPARRPALEMLIELCRSFLGLSIRRERSEHPIDRVFPGHWILGHNDGKRQEPGTAPSTMR